MNQETSMKIKTLRESVISMIANIKAMQSEDTVCVKGADARERIGDMVDELLDSFVSDESAWPFVKDRYLYDVYLQMREEEGTITSLDLTRPGLTSGLFSSDVEYHKHCVRVGESRSNDPAAMKTCTSCGLSKPGTKFSKRGGAVCFSCRGKQYRERKANRAD